MNGWNPPPKITPELFDHVKNKDDDLIFSETLDLLNTQLKKSDEQIKHLQSIAESQKKQVDLAIQESESAKRDALFAKIVSVISTLIAIIALFS